MDKNYLFKKVMIVDDTFLDSFITEKYIKKYHFGEEVVIFNTVLTAISHLQSLIPTPDDFPPFIFLDVNMPHQDGFDFLDMFEQFPDDIQRRCYIVMISATNSEEDFKKIKANTIVKMFFGKPMSEMIIKKIRAKIESKK